MANLLVVEDDEVFSQLLSMHLEDLGHTPLVARDLAQARKLLSEITPDLVLLDQQLPDGFGMDLLRKIKAEKDAPPVIMVTGVSDNTLVIEAMKVGAYDFVRKPMQASLRSRERFWDIRVPKIDSIFDNSLVPRPSWSPGVPPQHRKLVAATHRSPI